MADRLHRAAEDRGWAVEVMAADPGAAEVSVVAEAVVEADLVVLAEVRLEGAARAAVGELRAAAWRSNDRWTISSMNSSKN